MTAISLRAYPLVQDRYALLPHGASHRRRLRPGRRRARAADADELREREIVVPGRLTTAFLTLRLALGDVPHRVLPFDGILDEVAAGRAEAGLLIHEGQLTYEEAGLHKVLDLGAWWLPRPGCRCRSASTSPGATSASASATSRRCCARRSRPASTTATRRCATRCASAAASTRETADRFVGMYVNELTRDYGDEGREAVEELLRRGDAIGAFSEPSASITSRE